MKIRPLYLIATYARPLHVYLDGPSLRVEQPARSDGRYPLRLVSRVLSSGPVKWESSALYQLMERGITVTFETQKSGRRAVLLPHREKFIDANQQLEILLDQINGWVELEQWVASANRYQLIDLNQRLPVTGEELIEDEMQQVLQKRAEAYLTAQMIEQIRIRLTCWCSSIVAEVMKKEGLEDVNLHILHFNLENITLSEVITGIIHWDLEVVIYQLAKGISRRYGKNATITHPMIARLMLRAFEQRQPRLTKLANIEIVNYKNWLSRAVNRIT